VLLLSRADGVLEIAVDCPKCGARPALRVTRTIVEALASTPAKRHP
jgi:thymidine kinase